MDFDVFDQGCDRTRPLIYMWEIWSIGGELIGRYVGKAGGGSKRPLEHYKRNVENILLNKPYRRSKPAAFRRIHIALANAHRAGHSITLRFLSNVAAGSDINETEQYYIELHGTAGLEPWQLNGPRLTVRSSGPPSAAAEL